MTDSISNVFKNKVNKDTKMTEKKKKILEVSIDLFAKNGYSNTSTSQIAREAEVAEGTIFKHFGSKENLLIGNIIPFILEEIFPEVASDFTDDKLKGDYLDFETFIYSIVKDRIEFINSNEKICKIVITEVMYRDDLLKNLISSVPQKTIESFNNILNNFKANNLLVDWPNIDIIRFIITNIAGYAITKFILEDIVDFNDDEQIKKISRLLIKGLSK